MKFASIGFSLFIAAATAVTFACSSSSNSGGVTCSVSGSGTASSNCTSCLQSSCGTQYSNVLSACSDYIDCIDACNCTSSCVESCASKLSSQSACESAGQAIETCEMKSCESQCTSTATADAGNGGGSGGGTNVSCVSADGDSCSIFKASGPGSSDEVTAEQDACTMQKGTVGTSCPTAKLVGCCTLGGVDESCQYTGSASTAKTGCTMGGGTWSTTP